MNKNTDNKELAQSKDMTSGNAPRQELFKETQIPPPKETHVEAIEDFGHSFNKLVATVTGQKIESVADRLSPKMVERLHRGKILDQEMQTHNDSALSADDRQSLADYRKFKDTITRQIPLFDHDALVDTINTRIAERVSQNKANNEAPDNKNTKASSIDVGPAKRSDSIEQKTNNSEHFTSVIPHTEKQKAKVEGQTSTERKKPSGADLKEKLSQVPTAATSEHITKQTTTEPSGRRQTSERIQSPTMPLADKMPARSQEVPLTKEPHPISQKQELLPPIKLAIANAKERAEIHTKEPAQSASVIHDSKISEIAHNLSPVEQRKFSKNQTEQQQQQQQQLKFQLKSQSNFPSNSYEVQPAQALSERTIKILSRPEIYLQKSFSVQNEKTSENIALGNFKLEERLTIKSAAHVFEQRVEVKDGHLNSKPEPSSAVVISRYLPEVESLAIKRNFSDSARGEFGTNFKTPTKALSENQALAPTNFVHAHEQILTAPKIVNESLPNNAKMRLQNDLHADSTASTPTLSRAKSRPEFLYYLAIKMDGQKRLNLPVSNLLAKTPHSERGSKIANAVPKSESGIASVGKRTQLPNKLAVPNEKVMQPQPKEYVVVREQLAQRRYVLGTEIALAAIIASAGVARVRHERQLPHDLGSNNKPKTNPAFDIVPKGNCLDTQPTEDTKQSGNTVLKHEIVGRRFDDDIESFAVPASLLSEVKTNEKQFLQSIRKGFKQILGNRSSGQTIKNQPRFRPTILIQLNDTLQKIAERYFNDINVAWLIADLNRGNVKESYIDSKRLISLQSRQTLVLPVWNDIVSFYQNDFADVEIERLVTIVEITQVDCELYAQTFENVIENVIENNSTRIERTEIDSHKAQTEA